MKLGEV